MSTREQVNRSSACESVETSENYKNEQQQPQNFLMRVGVGLAVAAND